MLNEGTESWRNAGDASIDILELSRNRDIKTEAKEDPDATESSSSFGDTTSGNENNSGLSEAEAEVESQFVGESDLAPPFDEFGSMFPRRKKKLTTHWRNFVHPLMWRCKWAEIRIKELESQASKYTREVSINHGRYPLTLDQALVEQSGSKLLPFTHQCRIKKPMKRKKRKKVEDSTDIGSYMSNHVLFSDRENKRYGLNGVPSWENLGNSDHRTNDHDSFGIYNETVLTKESDTALERMLRKIELAQGRVHRMKAQLDFIMTKNAGKFPLSSSENLSQLMACDVQTSSAHSPMFSACNGDTISVRGLLDSSHHISDYDLGDLVIPDSTVSSFEAIPIPDIIESTVGLLSSIDVTQDHPQVGDSSEKIVDNIIINNEAEASTFKSSHNLSTEKTNEAENSCEEESNNNANISASENNVLVKQPEALKPYLASGIHFPKNKRKRGERKAGSGTWSRQRPGEPDN